jgi:long-chain acyl-CoA synthetase
MSISFHDACAAVCADGTAFEIGEADVFGVSTKVFKNAPPSLRALYGLAAMRETEFIVYEDERHTMPELLELAGRIGHALVNDVGVEKGDRVAISMRNYPEWIASFVAISAVGGVVVPMNAWWTPDEMAFALGDSTPKAIFVDRERLARLADIDLSVTGSGDDGTKAIAVRCTDIPDGVVALEELLVDGTTMPEVDIAPDDDATILYTSGTTGFPKGAVSTHRAILNALMAFMARATVGGLVDGVDPTATPSEGDPGPSFVLCVPLFHVTGLVPVMLGSFVSGARLIIMHKWEPGRALELIEREKVTNFVGVPTMSWDLLEHTDFESRDTSSLKSVGGGGAPMPPELVKRIEDSFSQGRPGLGYGMTETNAYGPQNSGDDFVANPTSTGRCVPIMDVRVTTDDGTELPIGETGEIWFKGPMLIRGYWNRPEANAETIENGWLRSGDIGRVENDGFVYVSDRAKDMILRGGENIYCAEVENAIYEHPDVFEAAVYGLPHERLGEEPAAHIMLRSGSDLSVEALQSFVGERIASFKVPATVTFVTEPLPRNAAGKILKREIRDQMVAALG